MGGDSPDHLFTLEFCPLLTHLNTNRFAFAFHYCPLYRGGNFRKRVRLADFILIVLMTHLHSLPASYKRIAYVFLLQYFILRCPLKCNEMQPAESLQHFIIAILPNIRCAVDFINRTKQGVVQTFVLVIGCLGDQKAYRVWRHISAIIH